MKYKVILFILFAGIVSCSGIAFAAGPDQAFGLTPYLGYHFIDERDYRNRPEFGLRAEMFFTSRWSAELGAGYIGMERQSTGEKKNGLTYSLNALYNLTQGGAVVPYLTAGVSGDYTAKKALTGPDAGIGARIFLTDWIALRPEVRYINLFKGREDFLVSLGLNFLFGGKTKTAAAAPAVAAAEKPAPAPAPAEKPAPAPAPVAAPLDSDHDGVPDALDKCPDTPAGVKVDANGCPLDSDNDGVPDYLDKCPGTPAGAKVDKDGCVISITLKVNFDTGKAVVKPAYLPEIERFAQFMKQYPDQKAEIQGHTDNVGSAKSNKALSEARAKAVREAAITKYGVAADRLTAKGYGPDKPVASNDTPEGRDKNRRVEAVLSK